MLIRQLGSWVVISVIRPRRHELQIQVCLFEMTAIMRRKSGQWIIVRIHESDTMCSHSEIPAVGSQLQKNEEPPDLVSLFLSLSLPSFLSHTHMHTRTHAHTHTHCNSIPTELCKSWKKVPVGTGTSHLIRKKDNVKNVWTNWISK